MVSFDVVALTGNSGPMTLSVGSATTGVAGGISITIGQSDVGNGGTIALSSGNAVGGSFSGVLAPLCSGVVVCQA